jgi:lysophospholipase L1-like esterase
MKCRFALSSALVLLAASALPARPLTIVAFGDSTTAPRSTIKQVYANRLPGLLKARGIEAKVINAGVGGSHTGRLADNALHKRKHALDRFDEAVRDRKPDVVIIQFGINDSWVDKGGKEGKSRIPLPAYRANLTYMVRTLKSDGARVLLMTPNAIGNGAERWRYDRLAGYAGAVREIAKAEGVELVDVWKAFGVYATGKGKRLEDLLLDRVHPNDAGHALVAGLLVKALADAKAPPRGYSIPIVDLDKDTERQVVVDREKGQYLGHPTTVLLEDGKTMICVYPKGHGRGAIVMKRSTDGGKTWSERLPVPKSWATSKEVPTIHRVVDAKGKKRLILFSGLYPVRMAVSEDDGKTWTELKPVGDWGGIVTMGCVVKLRTGKGHYMALFHDDGRFFASKPKVLNPKVMTLYKTFSKDGGLTWSFPEKIYASAKVHLCEPGAIRSPDGKQIAILLRENRRVANSHVMFTNDEGKKWSEPRPLPGALTGDRHTGKYAPDGRLFISFRDTTLESPTKGDWVGWVGTYEDIVRGREGQYRVRLKDNHKGADCAYPGVEVLPDGTFVTTTYGHWDAGEMPYVLSVRFKLSELDRRVKK